MKLKFFFNKYPVFRYEEFVEFMKQQKLHKPNTWRHQLNYHHKAGNLLHIRRYLYAVKSPFMELSEFWIDPYLIAGKATKDAIIAYHTALELHEIAYSTFEELTFITECSHRAFNFQGQRFRAVQPPKILAKQNKTDYETQEIQRQGVKIKITTLERTIVDVLDRPELSGGWEEVWRSLNHVTRCNPEKIVEYALLLNNATTIAKVGFYLEQRPPHLAIDQNIVNRLLTYIPKRAHYMHHNRNKKGKFFEKWQLIVPLEILERRWEEPNADI